MQSAEIKVQTPYDRLADIYDQRWRNYILNTLTFLRDWEPVKTQDKILNVACASPRFLFY
jgi:hypothetical protein